jgi:hypothetical protein
MRDLDSRLLPYKCSSRGAGVTASNAVTKSQSNIDRGRLFPSASGVEAIDWPDEKRKARKSPAI